MTISTNKELSRITDSQQKRRFSDATLLNIEAAINLIPYAGGFLATYFGETRLRTNPEVNLQTASVFWEQIGSMSTFGVSQYTLR